MTFDKFLKRNRLIAEHLSQIAKHRDSIGWVDSATPADGEFREVLAAQERLLNAAEHLLENCIAQSQRDARVIRKDVVVEEEEVEAVAPSPFALMQPSMASGATTTH